MLRKHIAKSPRNVMDYLENSFIKVHKHLLGSGAVSVSWSRSLKASFELIEWAHKREPCEYLGKMISDTKARDLSIVCSNAAELEKEIQRKSDKLWKEAAKALKTYEGTR